GGLGKTGAGAIDGGLGKTGAGAIGGGLGKTGSGAIDGGLGKTGAGAIDGCLGKTGAASIGGGLGEAGPKATGESGGQVGQVSVMPGSFGGGGRSLRPQGSSSGSGSGGGSGGSSGGSDRESGGGIVLLQGRRLPAAPRGEELLCGVSEGGSRCSAFPDISNSGEPGWWSSPSTTSTGLSGSRLQHGLGAESTAARGPGCEGGRPSPA
ncbi:unnamed protein product, partial [Rangifer tarandus platyrhynchus]